MILTELKIYCLRSIRALNITLNPRFNFIIGANGSGKTSILEALYLLSCGHSFRSREISPVVTDGEASLTIFSRAQNEQSISIQKSNHKPTQIKLNNQFCTSTSQLAYALPSLVFYSDIFQIIDAGSAVRRSLLDWGLFHVKHEYLSLWKAYKKVLKQRNALLKTRAPYSQFIPWDIQLDQLAESLHQLRQEYFQQWSTTFATVLKELTDVPCTIQYYKGWDRKNSGKSLRHILEETFASDNQKTYTHYGAHYADIIIESNDSKAKQVLSRGQQKIILFALKLAQADLLEQECLFLIDDYAAELDELHQKKLLNYLANRKGQYILTSTSNIDVQLIAEDQRSIFHIDQGSLTL